MRNTYIPEDHWDRIRRRCDEEYGAFFEVLRKTGFRVDDVLYSRNWQWLGDCVSLRERKTGKIRTVPYTSEIIAAITSYRKAVGILIPEPLSYFFPARRRGVGLRRKAHRSTMIRQFQKAVRLAGLEGLGYTIHSLRKCYARDLFRRTRSLLEVQRDLNHTNIATTALYVFSDCM